MEFDTVLDLNNHIKKIIENGNLNIVVKGELNNVKMANGNMFASIRDKDSALNVMSFGHANKSNVELKNGDFVLMKGKINAYPKNGSYSLISNKISLINNDNANILASYELTKKKYENMNYFSRKRQLPQYVNCIGIVTSVGGAALQDILYVFNENNFRANIIVKNCLVQGKGSSASIANAIKELDSIDQIELILVTRGGGSFEDLISFSSDKVIEAMYTSNKYFISGVGHEVDNMLSDYVADLRCPTPSVSAKVISDINSKLFHEILCTSSLIIMAKKDILVKIDMYEMMLKNYRNKNNSQKDMSKNIDNELNKLKSIKICTSNELVKTIERIKRELNEQKQNLKKYDIIDHLENGYAIVIKNNMHIDSSKNMKPGQKLKIKFKDGTVETIVS